MEGIYVEMCVTNVYVHLKKRQRKSTNVPVLLMRI